MFRHKDCGGQVLISLSESLRVVSPGIKITDRGVSPGLTELKSIGDKKRSGISYICKECGKEFLTHDDLCEIEVHCDADGEWHPVTEITVTEQYMFCQNCKRVVLGEDESSDEHLLHLREVLSLPTSCSRVSLDEVMLKLIK